MYFFWRRLVLIAATCSLLYVGQSQQNSVLKTVSGGWLQWLEAGGWRRMRFGWLCADNGGVGRVCPGKEGTWLPWWEHKECETQHRWHGGDLWFQWATVQSWLWEVPVLQTAFCPGWGEHCQWVEGWSIWLLKDLKVSEETCSSPSTPGALPVPVPCTVVIQVGPGRIKIKYFLGVIRNNHHHCCPSWYHRCHWHWQRHCNLSSWSSSRRRVSGPGMFCRQNQKEGKLPSQWKARTNNSQQQDISANYIEQTKQECQSTFPLPFFLTWNIIQNVQMGKDC